MIGEADGPNTDRKPRTPWCVSLHSHSLLGDFGLLSPSALMPDKIQKGKSQAPTLRRLRGEGALCSR
jgi:hypothetical protein